MLYSSPGTNLFSALIHKQTSWKSYLIVLFFSLATPQTNIILVSIPILSQNYFLKGH